MSEAPVVVGGVVSSVSRPGRAATVLQAHRVLSRALKVAMQGDKVARNVCTLVDSPTVDRAEVQPLTGAEDRQVLAAAAGHPNAARWSVALAL